MSRKEKSIADKIREHTEVDELTGCWTWKTARLLNNMKRPRIYANGMRQLAYRAAYEAFVAPIPAGLYVCHRCDNGLCCNPAHLFVGTSKENAQDAIRKGRWTRNAWKDGKCSKGHPITESNVTFHYTPGYLAPIKHRRCRLCYNAWHRARIAKHSKKKPLMYVPPPEVVKRQCGGSCKAGHVFDEANTKWRLEGKYWKRSCKACSAERGYRAYRLKEGLSETGDASRRYRYGVI